MKEVTTKLDELDELIDSLSLTYPAPNSKQDARTMLRNLFKTLATLKGKAP